MLKTALDWYNYYLGYPEDDSKLLNDLRKLLLGPAIVNQCTEGGKVSYTEVEHRLNKLKKTGCLTNSSVNDLIGLCALRPLRHGIKLPEDDKKFITALSSDKGTCDQSETIDPLPDDFKVLRCKDTTACVTFGSGKSIINNFFEYSNFEYLVHAKQIGEASSNGLIHLLTYRRDYESNTYVSTAVLKTAQSKDSDNLVYEYLVGAYYINKQIAYFPCFVETYGVYKYDPAFSNSSSSVVDRIKGLVKLDPLKNPYSVLTTSCVDSGNLSILIETIPNAITLAEFINLRNNLNFSLAELTFILFQVYAVLSCLKDTFTHYDLHANNVLLYKIPNDEYVTMTYKNLDGTVTSFRTKYIAKLIDYGRSFYYTSSADANDLSNSKKLYETITANSRCNNLRRNVGYGWSDPPSLANNYVSSLSANISHDLRLLNIIVMMLSKHYPAWSAMFNVHYYLPHGTPPIVNGRAIGLPANSIYNVSDAYERLRDYINSSGGVGGYNTARQAGIIGVYLDKSKPLQFIPTS